MATLLLKHTHFIVSNIVLIVHTANMWWFFQTRVNSDLFWRKNKLLHCDTTGYCGFSVSYFPKTMGAFLWDYSGYSSSGLGITEYTEFQFPKERSFILKTEYSWWGWPESYYVFQPEARRPARAAALDFPPKFSQKKSAHSVHSAIGTRINGMIFLSFRKRNSPQKNTNTVYSEYSYSGIVPKERALCWLFSERFWKFKSPGGGGGGLLWSILAEYVPLASQSPDPIIAYFVANYRPHLSHFWGNVNFAIPT